MVLDKKIQEAAAHFGVTAPEDWTEVPVSWLRQVPNVGPVTIDHLRIYLAARGLTLKDDATPEFWQKIIQINGRNLDLRASGHNMIVNYRDQPGALGKIGTLLGAADVNIEAAQLSQDAEGDGATIMLRLDRDVPEDVRTQIADAVGATLLKVVAL